MFVTHITNSKKFYEIKNIKDIFYVFDNIENPGKIIVKSGSEDAMIFVVDYLNIYDNRPMIAPPEYPLLDMGINDIFEEEQHIFKDFFESPLPPSKKVFLSNVLNISEELCVGTLVGKIAAIFNYDMVTSCEI